MKHFHMALLLTIILIGGGCAGIPQSRGDTTVERSIEVRNLLLNFVITPGNQTTVILEAGQGLDSTEWTAVRAMLANSTNFTIISYDREGFGKSGVDLENDSILREVMSLESGLDQLNVSGQVVYVAHSYGAFLAQIYTSRNPGKVKAIVLADPNTGCFNEEGGFTTLWKPPPYPNVSAANQRVLLAYPKTVQYMRTIADFPKNIPIIVITAGHPPVGGNRTALWRACHQKLVEGNPRGEVWVAENSSHLIPLDDPGLVVAAIRKAASENGSAEN